VTFRHFKREEPPKGKIIETEQTHQEEEKKNQIDSYLLKNKKGTNLQVVYTMWFSIFSKSLLKMQRTDSMAETLFEKLKREINEQRLKNLDAQPVQEPRSTTSFYHWEQLQMLKDLAAFYRAQQEQQAR